MATTHWAVIREGANESRKPRLECAKERLFTPEHIAVAWERLSETGWLEPARVLVST